jgi:RNA polymerase sigma-70 factor (ECF subfamily)
MAELLGGEWTMRMAGTGTEPGALDDATLVAAVARRDARALEVLVTRHGGWAARFAERLTGNAATAEEVVQDAFLRLWNNAERWEGRARFTTWFYRVLHNLAVDRLRLRNPQFEALDEALPDAGATPEQALEGERRDARVRAALGQLPERQRAALVLSHYEGLSQAEAAAVLQINEGALESLLSRARSRLRELLAAEREREERT